MCGIVGYIGRKHSFTPNKLNVLLLMNEERGDDAIGYYKLIDKTYHYDRFTDKALNVLKKNPRIGQECDSFIGHCRKASIGAKNKENTHPFKVKLTDKHEIILAHNGTIETGMAYDYCKSLDDDRLSYNKVDVDSQLFAYDFSINGKDSKKIISTFPGAYAIMWCENISMPNIKVARNNDRPLHYGKSEEGYYFSSESEPLEVIGCTDIVEIDPFTIVTFLKDEQDEVHISYEKYVYNPYKRPTRVHTTHTRVVGFTGPRNAHLIKTNAKIVEKLNAFIFASTKKEQKAKEEDWKAILDNVTYDMPYVYDATITDSNSLNVIHNAERSIFSIYPQGTYLQMPYVAQGITSIKSIQFKQIGDKVVLTQFYNNGIMLDSIITNVDEITEICDTTDKENEYSGGVYEIGSQLIEVLNDLNDTGVSNNTKKEITKCKNLIHIYLTDNCTYSNFKGIRSSINRICGKISDTEIDTLLKGLTNKMDEVWN